LLRLQARLPPHPKQGLLAAAAAVLGRACVRALGSLVGKCAVKMAAHGHSHNGKPCQGHAGPGMPAQDPGRAREQQQLLQQERATRWWVWCAVLCAARLAAAASCPVLDCDETFNFVEPVHYVLYGRGLQTWEYSPAFALRTYAYVAAHAAAALPFGLARGEGGAWPPQLGALLSERSADGKLAVYWGLRALAGLACAACEAWLLDGVHLRLGPRVAGLALPLLACSAAMFSAAPALLPSTTCMYCALLGYAAWLRGETLRGLAWGALAVLVCWPFCALMFVPMGLHALWERGVLPVAAVAAACTAAFVGVPAALDTAAYGRPTAAIANLLLYNALGWGGGGRGADLYGTEPWHFYAQNLALSMNIVAPLGAAAPLLVAALWRLGARPDGVGARASTGFVLALLAGPALTVAMFMAMAHKEERFLAPTFPLFCVAAALSLSALYDACVALFGRRSWLVALARIALRAAVLASCLLSLSRCAALAVNFGAPAKVYAALAAHGATGGVCVAKEWYRFPSSFFLPPGAQIRWLPSAFGGLLPQPFTPWAQGGARVLHAHFNDRNERDERAFSRLGDCDWAVDLAVGNDNGGIGDWSKGWQRVHCERFLDAARSPPLVRSFYVPFFSERSNVYADYCLLKRA
jgi:alpha-1,2-mannosyltransferase